MQANLATTLAAIRESEGADVNRDPGEPGGISKYGVSLAAYRDAGHPQATQDDIANLTVAQADEFYATIFLPRIRFDELPSGVDYRLADVEINSGQAGAVWIAELALGIWPLTNSMTDDVLAKIKAANPRDLVVAIGAVWIGQKFQSPKWSRYGHGWSNRRNRVDAAALNMIGESKQ